MKTNFKTKHPRVLRHRLGLNQQEFWSAVGVTQSGGSRYESGRTMPRPVSVLVRLVHVEGIDLARVRGEHIVVAENLRKANPSLYNRLKAQVRAKK
jgi:transcriptional regulator with XRE-family HTH domain